MQYVTERAMISAGVSACYPNANNNYKTIARNYVNNFHVMSTLVSSERASGFKQGSKSSTGINCPSSSDFSGVMLICTGQQLGSRSLFFCLS